MNHNEMREIAKTIAAKLESMQISPNSRGWDLIIAEVVNLRKPRVALVSGDMEREYVVGSPELDTAMSILVRNREEFTVKPVTPDWLK